MSYFSGFELLLLFYRVQKGQHTAKHNVWRVPNPSTRQTLTFAVCLTPARQIGSSPCARWITHGKPSGTRWTRGFRYWFSVTEKSGSRSPSGLNAVHAAHPVQLSFVMPPSLTHALEEALFFHGPAVLKLLLSTCLEIWSRRVCCKHVRSSILKFVGWCIVTAIFVLIFIRTLCHRSCKYIVRCPLPAVRPMYTQRQCCVNTTNTTTPTQGTLIKSKFNWKTAITNLASNNCLVVLQL